MADVTYEITITGNEGITHVASGVAVSSDLDAGNDVILSPHGKGISVNTDATIGVVFSSSSSSIPVKFTAGKIHTGLNFKKLIAADTDAGAAIVVYGD